MPFLTNTSTQEMLKLLQELEDAENEISDEVLHERFQRNLDPYKCNRGCV